LASYQSISTNISAIEEKAEHHFYYDLKGADLMIYEETKQNKRIESLEKELQKNDSIGN